MEIGSQFKLVSISKILDPKAELAESNESLASSIHLAFGLALLASVGVWAGAKAQNLGLPNVVVLGPLVILISTEIYFLYWIARAEFEPRWARWWIGAPSLLVALVITYFWLNTWAGGKLVLTPYVIYFGVIAALSLLQLRFVSKPSLTTGHNENDA